jgi:hemolysin III
MYHGERFNTMTHLAGLAGAVAATVLLIVQAAQHAGARAVVSFAIFGACMVLLYLASTVYHSTRGALKAAWAKVDHCAIYLLIAGTYTPFTLISLRGALGWWMFGAVWTLAALGIAKELIWGRRWPSVPIYLLMGWLGAVALVPLVRQLHLEGALWLLAGGVLYTVGVIFYAKDDEWPHAHGIWHLFVLGGTASHVVTVMYFVR